MSTSDWRVSSSASRPPQPPRACSRQQRPIAGRRAAAPRLRGGRSSTRSSPERPLALGRSGAAGQERQPLFEPREDLRRARAPSPARRRARVRAGGRRGGGRSRRPLRRPAKSGLTARARARKKSTPSSCANGGTGYSCSPARWSGSRLVTSSSRWGHAASSAASSAAASTTCSKLSNRSSIRLSAMCAARPFLRAEDLRSQSRARARGREAGRAAPTRRHPDSRLRRARRGLGGEPGLARCRPAR